MAGVLLGTIVGARRDGAGRRGRGPQDQLPFGPFLAAGGMLALFAGPAILHWYLHAI